MIEVVVETELADGEWESLVAHCGGHALHLPAIHLLHQDPSSLLRLVFRREGRPVACALALTAASRRMRFLPKGPPVLHLPTAPAIAEDQPAWDVWEALLAFALDHEHPRLVVEPAYSRWSADLEPLAPYRTDAITEFVIDLRGGVDQVLAGMHKVHRKNIRRAEKQGLVVLEDSSLQGLLDLRRMQLASSDRASERAEGFAVGEDAFFEKLHAQVYSKGYGHVVFAASAGERVAALAWLSAAGRVQTVRSGSLPSGYESRAMYVLHDALIRRVVGEGAVELNIGGVPAEAAQPSHPQAGLYEFKKGFGGEACVRHGLDVPVKEWSR